MIRGYKEMSSLMGHRMLVDHDHWRLGIIWTIQSPPIYMRKLVFVVVVANQLVLFVLH